MNYGIKYKEFMSIDGMKNAAGNVYQVDQSGFYTTVVANEVIRTPGAWISFRAWAGAAELQLKLNNSAGVFRVPNDSQAHGVDGLEINRITVLGDAGQTIRLEGLSAY